MKWRGGREKKKKQMHSAKIRGRPFHQLKQGGNLVNGCGVGGRRLSETSRKSGDPEKHGIKNKGRLLTTPFSLRPRHSRFSSRASGWWREGNTTGKKG